MERTLILPAAGAGSRFSGPVPKPLVTVDGEPMILRVLTAVRVALPGLKVVVVVRSEQVDLFEDALRRVESDTSIVVDDTFSGSAGAVSKALTISDTPEVVVAWPDHLGIEFLPPQFLGRAIGNDHSGFLPVVQRLEPYAAVEVSDAGELSCFHPPAEVARLGIREAPSDCGSFVLQADACDRFITSDLDYGCRDHNLVAVLGRLTGRDRLEAVWVDDWRASLGVNSPEDLDVYVAACRHEMGPQ